MGIKKSFYRIGIVMALALLALPGCGPIGQLIVESVPPVSGIALAQEDGQARVTEGDLEINLESVREVETAPAPAFAQGAVLNELQSTLSGIYDAVNPAVVSIQVTQRVSSRLQQLPFSGATPQTEDQYQQGAGSGFVWDKQGHIVTNYHVIEDADKIRVQFYDGANVLAELVGADPDSDLAVLKVNVPAGQLHPVSIADSAQVRVGQLAVAIGNPFGLQNTMTVGFISAIGRSLRAQGAGMTGASYTIPDVIQTDAPINPGNSGGVLVNEKGEVIGVPSAIISPVRASVGIGFAVPSAIVQKIVPALIAEGSYTHAWLGISGATLTPDVAQAMGLDEGQRGALVITVQENGPAGEAGVRGSTGEIRVDGQTLPTGGDIIIALAGNTVNTFEDLVANLARFAAGETVSLTVIRDGAPREIDVTLGKRPQSTALVPVTPQQDDPLPAPQGAAWLGIMAMTLNPQINAAMNLPAGQQGILVGQIQPGSPADEAGLRGGDKLATLEEGQAVVVGGDVIIAWNGEALASMPELQARLRQAQPGNEITLTIIRSGEEQALAITLGSRP
jgi:serine protease Do